VENIIKLKLIIDKTPLIIVCIYRSPSSDNNEFLTTLVEIIDKEKSASDYLIITGDMNINIVENNMVDNEYLDKLSEYGFVSYINV